VPTRRRGSAVDREQWALSGLRKLVDRARADGRDHLTADEDRESAVLLAMLDGVRAERAKPPPERARSLALAAAAALDAERETTRTYLSAIAREGWALGQIRQLAARVRADGRDTLTAAEDVELSKLAYMLDSSRQVQGALLAGLAEQLAGDRSP
jgi:hypothetical protein